MAQGRGDTVVSRLFLQAEEDQGLPRVRGHWPLREDVSTSHLMPGLPCMSKRGGQVWPCVGGGQEPTWEARPEGAAPSFLCLWSISRGAASGVTLWKQRRSFCCCGHVQGTGQPQGLRPGTGREGRLLVSTGFSWGDKDVPSDSRVILWTY